MTSNPSAAPSVGRAIPVLQQIQAACGPERLAYWVMPNTILTLCGARAYCDGVFWSDDHTLLELWNKEIRQSLDVVKASTQVIGTAAGVRTVRQHETFASFEVVFKEGLLYVLQQTELLDRALPQPKDGQGLEAILHEWRTALRLKKQFAGMNDQDLTHVAFGILLGYPDKAIIASASVAKNDTALQESFIDATIQYADHYICPQPVYSYPEFLAGEATIRAHEQLWSGLLREYYASDFHTKLQTDAGFMAKMHELGNID